MKHGDYLFVHQTTVAKNSNSVCHSVVCKYDNVFSFVYPIMLCLNMKSFAEAITYCVSAVLLLHYSDCMPKKKDVENVAF